MLAFLSGFYKRTISDTFHKLRIFSAENEIFGMRVKKFTPFAKWSSSITLEIFIFYIFLNFLNVHVPVFRISWNISKIGNWTMDALYVAVGQLLKLITLGPV